jgi:hypothetical protein
MSDLRNLIKAYYVAQAAWRKLDEATVGVTDNSPEWRAYDAAENAVLFFPCQTIEDVRLVARFALDEEMALDSLMNCTIGDVPVVSIFLRALLGEART